MTTQYSTEVPRSAVSLLRDLSLHLSRDAAANGSDQTDNPYGKVYEDWAAAVKKLGRDNSEPALFARRMVTHLNENAGYLALSSSPASMWQKLKTELTSSAEVVGVHVPQKRRAACFATLHS